MSFDHIAFRNSLGMLTMELQDRLLGTDWSSPEEVQHADRLMRVLSAYGRNIEKCIAMTEDTQNRDDTTAADDAEAERLRGLLYDKLVRYADRLGEEELARRLELDRADAGTERVEVFRPQGSIPSGQ